MGENTINVVQNTIQCCAILLSLLFFRVLGWLLWLSSIISYLLCNILFSVLIHLNTPGGSHGNPNTYLVVLRVATLDGLFLIMGITLAVFILIVSALYQ